MLIPRRRRPSAARAARYRFVTRHAFSGIGFVQRSLALAVLLFRTLHDTGVRSLERQSAVRPDGKTTLLRFTFDRACVRLVFDFCATCVSTLAGLGPVRLLFDS